MNDLDELKQFVTVHTRAQQLDPARCAHLLARVTTDEGAAPGSWVGEWTREAEDLERQGRLLEAARHHTLARFPFVDGDARRRAQDHAIAAFDRWRRTRPGIERLDVPVPGGGTARTWSSGLDADTPRPVLLFLGGIVTVKEQWAPALEQAAGLGMAMIVAEMPGVGENTAAYGPDSWRMLPALLDAVADRADTGRTYAIAHSFSGHMALRWAAQGDPRIRAIATAGAPVADFFTDEVWWPHVPRVTVDTLAHLLRVDPRDVHKTLADGWALGDAELAAVDIPVRYIESTRDEIIPASDAARLRRHLRDVDIVAYDDVHGAPDHAAEARLWTVLAILRARDARGPQRAVIAGMHRLTRLRRTLRTRRRRAHTPEDGPR
ncbi:esterase FrsA [Yinghuangia sp. ASG 101]|uniref:alpha/beta fold hydrolase n=1 Tax=Yinghuangia sp. ASG 101 TaxID=2896848 RepID=UPI001E3C12E8|nr:alpha/beta fold hydrolase [Yinghuangia sp. ASG 101]UGQ12414.1 esterase FrsA [Yinghuangia sp. ASG 101]